MAYQRYYGYQYETSPRKLEPEYRPIENPYKNKKTTTKKKATTNNKKSVKHALKPKIKVALYIAAGFAILFTISYRNSLITERFNQKEKLGMQKLDNSQKIYINLPKKDYIESAAEEVVIDENLNIWQKIIKGLTESIK